MGTINPVTTLVAGLGRSGWGIHIKRLRPDRHFRITAVVDTVEERREEAGEILGCATFATIEEALKAKLAELAIICTRSADHPAHAIAALKAGCHVLVEKPPATSVRDLDRVIAAAKKTKKVLAVNNFYEERVLDEGLFAREVVRSGVLGKVFWVRCSWLTFWRRRDWQTLKRFGGGILNNVLISRMELLLDLLDSPVERVCGHTAHTVTAGDAEDFVKVSLVGKNERLVEVEVSYGSAIGQSRWLVCGTTGSMQIEGETATIRSFDPRLAPALGLFPGTMAERSWSHNERLPWQEITVRPEPKKPAPDFYDALYKSIRKGTKPPLTAEKVREGLVLVEKLRRQLGDR